MKRRHRSPPPAAPVPLPPQPSQEVSPREAGALCSAPSRRQWLREGGRAAAALCVGWPRTIVSASEQWFASLAPVPSSSPLGWTNPALEVSFEYTGGIPKSGPKLGVCVRSQQKPAPAEDVGASSVPSSCLPDRQTHRQGTDSQPLTHSPERSAATALTPVTLGKRENASLEYSPGPWGVAIINSHTCWQPLTPSALGWLQLPGGRPCPRFPAPRKWRPPPRPHAPEQCAASRVHGSRFL